MPTKMRRDQLLAGIVSALSGVVLGVLCVERLWRDPWTLYFVAVALGVGALATFQNARRCFARGFARTRSHHVESK